MRYSLGNAPAGSSGWSWRGIDRDTAVEQCQLENGFDSSIAVTQLNRACSSENRCDFLVQQYDNNGRIEFDVTMPVLKAPVALSFALETTLASGELYSQEQTICGIAINEAPDVNDDYYIALTTKERTVPASSALAIFANDTDDVHVLNQPLFIKEIISGPAYAEDLFLRSDGSFQYLADSNLALSNDDYLDDQFVIRISDGVYDVDSTVNLRLKNFNTGPSLVTRIPDYEVTVDDDAGVDIDLDLTVHFADIDDDPLRYRLLPNQFTDSGSLTLDANGRLTGRLTLPDLGSDRITVYVTDGLEELRDRFRITVLDARPQNNAPLASDIPNAQVSGSFRYGIWITDAGVLMGNASDENEGRWLIRITANDGRGGVASDQFRLTVDH